MKYDNYSWLEAEWLNQMNMNALRQYSEDWRNEAPEGKIEPLEEVIHYSISEDSDNLVLAHKDLAISCWINDQPKKKIIFFLAPSSQSNRGKASGDNKKYTAKFIEVKNIGQSRLECEIYAKEHWLKVKINQIGEGARHKGKLRTRTKGHGSKVNRPRGEGKDNKFSLLKDGWAIIEVEPIPDALPKGLGLLRGEIMIHKIQSCSQATQKQIIIQEQVIIPKQIIIPVIVLAEEAAFKKPDVYPPKCGLGVVWRGKDCKIPIRIENRSYSPLRVSVDGLESPQNPFCVDLPENEKKKIIAPHQFGYIHAVFKTTCLDLGKSIKKLNLKCKTNGDHIDVISIPVSFDVYCYFAHPKDINFGCVRRGEEKSQEISFLYSHDYLIHFELKPPQDEANKELMSMLTIQALSSNSFKLICRPPMKITPRSLKTHLVVEAIKKKGRESFKVPLMANIIS